MIRVLFALAALLATTSLASAQQTKAQMNTYNNNHIGANGQNAVTGPIVNNMNSQMIGAMCGLATAADCVLPPGAASGGIGPLGGVLTGTLPNPGMATGAAAANVGTLSGVLTGTLPAPGLAAGAAAANIGTLSGVLTGTLPNPGLAAGVAAANIGPLGSGHVFGNGTGAAALGVSTPLATVMQQPGSGVPYGGILGLLRAQYGGL